VSKILSSLEVFGLILISVLCITHAPPLDLITPIIFGEAHKLFTHFLLWLSASLSCLVSWEALLYLAYFTSYAFLMTPPVFTKLTVRGKIEGISVQVEVFWVVTPEEGGSMMF